MTEDTKTTLRFRVWYQGSNMPGYMPDEPPHPCESWESARELLVFDIRRDIDNLEQSESYRVDDVQRLERAILAAEAATPDEDIAGTVGNRHYFILEDTMTADELEDCDCDPSDYSPILDEWIDCETLDALENAGINFGIVEAQTKSEQSDDEWKTCKVYDDSFGSWFVGERECGAWIVPSLIIRAESWESAYGIFEDESPTVPEDELHEAYDMTPEEFQAVCDRMTDEDIDYPELADGYSYQSNASDTGIVYTADMHLEAAGAEHNQVRFRVTMD